MPFTAICGARNPHPRRRLSPSAGRAAFGAGSALARKSTNREHKVYGVSHAAAAAAAAAAPRLPRRATLHAAKRRPRAERDQVEKLYNALSEAKKKAGENRLRQSRQLHLLRSEENRTDPQAVRLRQRRVLRRSAGRPGEAESQSENLVAQSSVLSRQHIQPIVGAWLTFSRDGSKLAYSVRTESLSNSQPLSS